MPRTRNEYNQFVAGIASRLHIWTLDFYIWIKWVIIGIVLIPFLYHLFTCTNCAG